ncbi:MAG: uroporphyrinogen-III synthase [Chitinophagales bacterium]
MLISQPEPENGKSPYYDIAKKYNIKVDFRKFIQVEGVSTKEFRKSRIVLNDYSAVIFTSRNSMDYFFSICESMRVKMSQETKYFCKSEAIALYLQKYIQYRKRKVFFGSGREEDLREILMKHKENEKFLLPCSNVSNSALPDFLEEKGFDFKPAVMYKTVSSDLSDLENIFYDIILFFSPHGLKSLFENFPDFKQNNTKLGAFGDTTAQAMEDYGLSVNIKAPAPGVPSMTMAVQKYLDKYNK